MLEAIHNRNLKFQEQVRNIKEDIEEESCSLNSRVFKHLSRGGLRGLQVLSLSECRNLSDKGLADLCELKYLRKLNLLWCTKIEDEGLSTIAKNFGFLKHLDIGGTNISSGGLRDLVANSKSLKIVSIMGCKKLNNSDDQILLRQRIDCQGVEDVFRFHLLPE